MVRKYYKGQKDFLGEKAKPATEADQEESVTDLFRYIAVAIEKPMRWNVAKQSALINRSLLWQWDHFSLQ